jgi:hypothetical protein
VSEAPAPRPERPGFLRIGFTAFLGIWFAVKAIRWWLAVRAGNTVVEKMTGWDWVVIAFYHVAVVVAVFALVEMFRERAKPSGDPPDTTTDPAGTGDRPGQ